MPAAKHKTKTITPRNQHRDGAVTGPSVMANVLSYKDRVEADPIMQIIRKKFPSGVAEITPTYEDVRPNMEPPLPGSNKRPNSKHVHLTVQVPKGRNAATGLEDFREEKGWLVWYDEQNRLPITCYTNHCGRLSEIGIESVYIIYELYKQYPREIGKSFIVRPVPQALVDQLEHGDKAKGNLAVRREQARRMKAGTSAIATSQPMPGTTTMRPGKPSLDPVSIGVKKDDLVPIFDAEDDFGITEATFELENDLVGITPEEIRDEASELEEQGGVDAELVEEEEEA